MQQGLPFGDLEEAPQEAARGVLVAVRAPRSPAPDPFTQQRTRSRRQSGWTGTLASARQGETVAELLIQDWYAERRD